MLLPIILLILLIAIIFVVIALMKLRHETEIDLMYLTRHDNYQSQNLDIKNKKLKPSFLKVRNEKSKIKQETEIRDSLLSEKDSKKQKTKNDNDSLDLPIFSKVNDDKKTDDTYQRNTKEELVREKVVISTTKDSKKEINYYPKENLEEIKLDNIFTDYSSKQNKDIISNVTNKIDNIENDKEETQIKLEEISFNEAVKNIRARNKLKNKGVIKKIENKNTAKSSEIISLEDIINNKIASLSNNRNSIKKKIVKKDDNHNNSSKVITKDSLEIIHNIKKIKENIPNNILPTKKIINEENILNNLTNNNLTNKKKIEGKDSKKKLIPSPLSKLKEEYLKKTKMEESSNNQSNSLDLNDSPIIKNNISINSNLENNNNIEDKDDEDVIFSNNLTKNKLDQKIPISLLTPESIDLSIKQSDDLLLANSVKIEEKLAEYKVGVKVLDAYSGPVITRYEIEPFIGVRGSQIINLEKDLARSLGYASIRIVETIPGKTCMGIELPNPKRQIIRLSAILDNDVFKKAQSNLTLALGQDITGAPIVMNLAKAPHLLVAGTTGSGKSVAVNAMILSLLYKSSPDDVRLIMIDPKMLELSIYDGIPHLLAPVVTDVKLAASALIWCVNEMEKRYKLMSYFGVRNISGFNLKINEAKNKKEPLTNPFSLNKDDPELIEKLPSIVVVVDEFADLMMSVGKKVEELIARLAQKARAAGIHLILATQRPSVDVITGLIKANIPTRIAFQVSSKIDSRTILDQMGAENLLGQGDMLYLPPGSGYPMRIHGAFVDDKEVHKVVNFLKQFGEPEYIDDIITSGVGVEDLFSNGNTISSSSNDVENDPLYDEAVNVVLQNKKASISYVQRNLRIGYNRAARLIEQMEKVGIVSPPESNGNRTILINNNNDHS